jgi:hypothetical protein
MNNYLTKDNGSTADMGIIDRLYYYTHKTPTATALNDFLRTANVSFDRIELQLVRVFGGSVPSSIQYMTYGLRD